MAEHLASGGTTPDISHDLGTHLDHPGDELSLPPRDGSLRTHDADVTDILRRRGVGQVALFDEGDRRLSVVGHQIGRAHV